MIGKVISYARTFGFIAPADGSADVFFHRDVIDGIVPRQSDMVEFEAEFDERQQKRRAVSVYVIGR